MRRLLLFSFIFAFWGGNAFAQEALVSMERFYPEQLEVAGFTLDTETEILIEASSLQPYRNRRSKPVNDAWILNSDSREIVWEMRYADDVDRDRDIIRFANRVTLPPGNYEAYFSSYVNNYYFNDWDDHPGDFFDNLFGHIFYDHDDPRRLDYDELYFRVSGNGRPVDEQTVFNWQEQAKDNALINWTNLRDDAYFEKILYVTAEAEISIYALGEARDDGAYDFGQLIRLDNRDKVWELDYRKSGHAGGATKNRLSDEVVRLSPGYYKIFYVTDDSHSYRRWNSSPPYDPAFWGIVIKPESDNAAQSIQVIDDEEYSRQHPTVVEFERVGDNDYRMEGFTLKKELKLHIYALGEGRDGDMYDYGWIVEAKSRDRVWEMDYFDTENAGGADKNRLFDGIITLPAGDYTAYYVTDGSHSYIHWNSGKPVNPRKWGMTISVIDENYTEGDVVAYEPTEDKDVLARIIRVEDHDRARSTFKLEQDSWVHIYAMGEGLHNEMYDYAWIEDARGGRIVWEMTYRMTRNAGGARKNRLFNDRIYLEAGEYEVHYRSDDSHSFSHWNDDPPYDPFNYGITVTLAK